MDSDLLKGSELGKYEGFCDKMTAMELLPVYLKWPWAAKVSFPNVNIDLDIFNNIPKSSEKLFPSVFSYNCLSAAGNWSVFIDVT